MKIYYRGIQRGPAIGLVILEPNNKSHSKNQSLGKHSKTLFARLLKIKRKRSYSISGIWNYTRLTCVLYVDKLEILSGSGAKYRKNNTRCDCSYQLHKKNYGRLLGPRRAM